MEFFMSEVKLFTTIAAELKLKILFQYQCNFNGDSTTYMVFQVSLIHGIHIRGHYKEFKLKYLTA